MPQSVFEIKERLVRVLAENGTVGDMAVATDAITSLEGLAITKEDLEKTRLGLYVNQVRKAANGNPLARRAKNLIKSWQQMILQGSPPVPHAVRPQTPNSVGSSPSPPDPSIHSNVVNHVQVRTPPVFPAQGNPGILNTGENKRKHSKNSKGNRLKGKSPVTVKIDDGKVKGHSSDVKGQIKQSPDSGQHMVSVVSPNTNGLKLTFKMQSVTNDDGEEEDVNVTENDGNQKWRQTILDKNNDTGPPTPHKKDGRKKHKKKKSHKNSLKNSPSPSPLVERVNPSQEDMYNNNKNEMKMATSQSTPNFTVTKQSVAGKQSSPDKVPLLENNKTITKPQSTGDLKSLPMNSNPNLKRKREQSMVNNSTPNISQEDKPRGSKERRLTLTYDPLTKQLQQVAATAPPEKSNEEPTTPQSPETSPKTKITNSVSPPTRTLQKQFISEPKPDLKLHEEPPKVTTLPLPQNEVPLKLEEVGSDEFPTALNPVIRINDASNSQVGECSGNCVANFYETRREFRKRKTRRKEHDLDLATLFPISNFVTPVDTSDSDESGVAENGFCSTIKLDEKPESSDRDMSHSSNCKRSGVTGCRGNNGVWYDWFETFCVRNKNSDKSDLLPEESEVMPLHVLPYVELD